MSFDYEKYSKLMNEFIAQSVDIRKFRDKKLCDNVVPLCRMLRIARLSTDVFGSRISYMSLKEGPYVYFDDGGR